MIDICFCGSQAGYPHDSRCPFPLYHGDGLAWLAERYGLDVEPERCDEDAVHEMVRLLARLEETDGRDSRRYERALGWANDGWDAAEVRVRLARVDDGVRVLDGVDDSYWP